MIELYELAKNKSNIYSKSGAVVVSSEYEVIKLAEDKWKLALFLEQNGYPYASSIIPDNSISLKRFLKAHDFPFIIKDRFGSGSQGFARIHDALDMDYFIQKIENPVLQEYLFPDDEEYTVGVFIEEENSFSIVMKRLLNLGMTWKAEILPGHEFGTFCEDVARKIGLTGPANLQLRNTKKGPVIFEINPRLSSTTASRALFGYNDPEMCIKKYVLKEPLKRPEIIRGRLFRKIEELKVCCDRFNQVQKTGYISNNE